MGIKILDIVDIALAGALENHSGKHLNETVLARIRNDCGELEASAFEPFAVQPDIDGGSLSLSFERRFDEDSEDLASAFSSLVPSIENCMDGGYYVTFTYDGVFQ